MEAHIIPQHEFPVKIDDDLFMLGNYFFNLFLIRGKKSSALFEVGTTAGVDEVIRQLEALDTRLDYIIVSHPHSDHISGLPGLVEKFPDAEVIIAEGARTFIEHPKAGPALFKEDAFISKRLSDFRITPGRAPLDVIPDLRDARIVNQKESIDLGGIQLDLVTAEGHSPGNLLGMIYSKKALFCSDNLGFHYPGRGFQPLFFTRADAYLETLNFIQDYAPRILCPGHQGFLKGGNATKGIRRSLEATERIIRMIQSSPLDETALRKKIFKQSYVDEFTIYTEDNIQNCTALLIKRAKELDTF